MQNGLYIKTDHILQAMREAIPLERNFSFKNHPDGTVTLTCDLNYRFEFPSSQHGLGTLLGFQDVKGPLPSIAKGDYSVDLKRGVYGLYLYSDIIQPHIVGDVFAPLLRVIPVQEDERTSQSYVKIYSSPDYYPLTQNRFETVEIDIRSDFGQRLKFRNGKTFVKLHFKKV